MKKLEIKITKAQIESFTVILAEEKPEVSASIALLTEGGKKITSYSVSTNAWNEANKFELPSEMVLPILKITQEIEKLVVGHCKNQENLLN